MQKYNDIYFLIIPVACAGFILAGAEKKLGGAESPPRQNLFLPEIKKVILYSKNGFKRSF